MKSHRHRNRWLVAGAMTVMLLLVTTRFAEPEPRFEGRRLSDWLDDPGLSEPEITRGVRGVGTNAIPQLQAWFTTRPAVIERIVRQIDQRIDYIGIGYHPSLDANFRAMRGFLALGESAAPAIPWFEAGAARRDADLGFHLKALLACGPEGWEAFDRLEADAIINEPAALFAALNFGVSTWPELAPRLAKHLAHPDLEVRTSACATVRLLHEKCPPELLAALRTRMEREANVELRTNIEQWVDQLAKVAGDGDGGRVAP